MSSNINELKLYFGDDYPINDYITLHQPKVNDVIEMGEADYYSTVYALTAIPSDMKSQSVCYVISKLRCVKDIRVFW